MPRLSAKGSLRYASRDMTDGEEFEASEKDAFVLTKIGKASIASSAVGEPKEQPRQKRRYQRRDMVAKV